MTKSKGKGYYIYWEGLSCHILPSSPVTLGAHEYEMKSNFSTYTHPLIHYIVTKGSQ